MISTKRLIDELEYVYPNGLQISNGVGIMNSTKAIYIRKSLIYLFSMGDAFLFSSANGYTKEEFVIEYNICNWKIEEIIS
ncbi:MULTISPECIES: hypothetical protein [unclassified Mucilaginibacter]|uniref:hypothetical protein n=1 Tax=unclassified Mucilaginibacter TaxID=2617802 RepID=UPI002AC9C716|nr:MULTISPECIES: hypothetical protein [unclassified Mucilaginibacter]MEB0262589.1 hypothetical protein [Mucilaginibacter sp. 10I4]MEB0279208.1 hypothetical protein [Mucilaginibacter sp. 10B2]MEB0300692.1 hypothetical protein [Mucilaginibacter sp. 5C4]WPX23280.1 hypothetical protein RHM67_18530 [Mucilaginibacter sp. 5C4]